MSEKKIPSKYQQAIYEEYHDWGSNRNIFVNAGPGSGKSHTILELLKMTPYGKKAILTAFNKSIADELKTRVPIGVEVSTIHSLGFSTLRKNLFGRFKVIQESNMKTYILAKEVIENPFKELKNGYKRYMIYIFTIAKLYDLYRLNLAAKTEESLQALADEYSVELFGANILSDTIKVIDKLHEYNNRKHKETMIDFTDMLWFPYIQVDESVFPKYDVVFIDESQDLNPLQRELILRLRKKTGRFVAVGDEKQCQPIGTKVLKNDNTEVNIEDLKIGDPLISYDTKWKGGFIGYIKEFRKDGVKNGNLKRIPTIFVEDIQKRLYDDILIKVYSDNKISSYTPNHKCLVRWREDCCNHQCLYLMEKNGYFRIGRTPLFTKNGTWLALSQRFNGEQADKLWILSLYKTREEAYFEEQYHSVKYGIPQNVFLADKTSNIFNQETLDKFYEKFDKNELLIKANVILKKFNKYYDLPFKQRGFKNYTSKLHMFETYACNIFEDNMQVIHFDINNVKIRKSNGEVYCPLYKNIDKLELVNYKGFVYSLKVSKYENYVADGILTHNSIYSFMGSNLDSLRTFQTLPNTVVLPLSISYRFGKNIATYANEDFPDSVEGFEGNEDGIIRTGSIIEIMPGDFLLCRNNAPLFEAFLELITQDKKAYIMGKDFGKELNNLIDSVDTEEEFNELLNKKYDDLIEKGIKDPYSHKSYVALQEKVDIIRLVMIKKRFNLDQTKDLFSMLFQDKEDRNKITLSTIHRSKGLESDRVFWLEPGLIPSKYAVTELEIYQERCLRFVCKTRAKKELIILESLSSNQESYSLIDKDVDN